MTTQTRVIDAVHLIETRKRALELAIDTVPGAKFGIVLKVARLFELYILEGKTDEGEE